MSEKFTFQPVAFQRKLKPEVMPWASRFCWAIRVPEMTSAASVPT